MVPGSILSGYFRGGSSPPLPASGGSRPPSLGWWPPPSRLCLRLCRASPLCPCLSSSVSYKDPDPGFRATPVQEGPHLDYCMNYLCKECSHSSHKDCHKFSGPRTRPQTEGSPRLPPDSPRERGFLRGGEWVHFETTWGLWAHPQKTPTSVWFWGFPLGQVSAPAPAKSNPLLSRQRQNRSERGTPFLLPPCQDFLAFNSSEPRLEVRWGGEATHSSCKHLLEWRASGRGMRSFLPSCRPPVDRVLNKGALSARQRGRAL